MTRVPSSVCSQNEQRTVLMGPQWWDPLLGPNCSCRNIIYREYRIVFF